MPCVGALDQLLYTRVLVDNIPFTEHKNKTKQSAKQTVKQTDLPSS